jgi:hypothetical protein
VKTANLSKVRKETEVPELEVEDDPYDMTPVWVAPPLSEKVEPPFMDKTNGGSSGDKLLELTQVWEGPEEPQGLQHPDCIAVQLTGVSSHAVLTCQFTIVGSWTFHGAGFLECSNTGFEVG